MNPVQIRIADTIARAPDKPKKGENKEFQELVRNADFLLQTDQLYYLVPSIYHLMLFQILQRSVYQINEIRKDG